MVIRLRYAGRQTSRYKQFLLLCATPPRTTFLKGFCLSKTLCHQLPCRILLIVCDSNIFGRIMAFCNIYQLKTWFRHIVPFLGFLCCRFMLQSIGVKAHTFHCGGCYSSGKKPISFNTITN